MTTKLTKESEPDTLLAIEDLHLQIGRGADARTILDGVSFSLARHETVGLVGESGSGKSLTAMSILGLLPPNSTIRGSIIFDGKPILGLGTSALQRIRGDRIGMVFQDPLSSLNPFYSVGDQIAEAYRTHRGGSRRAAMKLAQQAMDRVHIRGADRRVRDYPHQFSGGMRQRIMIAMALVCEPDLIICDEPTTALDVTVQAQILTLLGELQQATGAGILFITHNLAVVSQLADRIVVLKEGNVVETGTTEQVFSRPEHPYTRMLIGATPLLSGPYPVLPEVTG